MDAARPTILIADDDRGVLQMVAEYLGAKGFDVRVAEDGLQAVVQASKLKPAVILLDYDMPAAAGDVVLRRLRGVAATAFTPVVFLTGKPDALARHGIVEGEKIKILAKPPPLADIEAAIRRFLPATAFQPAAAAVSPLPPREPSGPTDGPRRVLVIDDDITILDVLRLQLESAGFESAAFRSGREGLAYLQDHVVDLILLDLMIDGESGLDVCRAVRAATGADFVPIIILTAKGDTKSLVEGLGTGADEYLVKPHKAPELIARIRSMLRLKDAMDRLRRADAFKEEMLAITAHDLRNPIANIKGFAELLLKRGETEDDAARDKKLTIIVKNGEFMIQLLDRLYQRTRFEATELVARRIATEPAAMIAGLVAKNVALSQSKGIRLDCENRLPFGYTAPLDPGLFEEVAVNLVGNALKFTPAGGSVRVTLSSRNGSLELAVADTGPGIAPREQGAVFEKFRRAAGSRMSEGMGYGLAIVAKFAQLHGGRVELDSAPGSGSTFTVFFPEK